MEELFSSGLQVTEIFQTQRRKVDLTALTFADPQGPAPPVVRPLRCERSLSNGRGVHGRGIRKAFPGDRVPRGRTRRAKNESERTQTWTSSGKSVSEEAILLTAGPPRYMRLLLETPTQLMSKAWRKTVHRKAKTHEDHFSRHKTAGTTPNQATRVSILIATREHNIVLDAGKTVSQTGQGPCPIRILYFLFLSHFHLDHLIGLHALSQFSFSQKLTTVGSQGTEKCSGLCSKQPFTAPLDRLSTRRKSLKCRTAKNRFPFSVKAMDLVHPPLSMGTGSAWRKRDRLLPDTGYCEKPVTLARARISSSPSARSCPATTGP